MKVFLLWESLDYCGETAHQLVKVFATYDQARAAYKTAPKHFAHFQFYIQKWGVEE